MSDETQREERRHTIPGFTADQTWSVKAVIREAVSEGVSKGLEAYQTTNCAQHQKSTEELKRTVFGASEDGVVGLDERMNRVEAFERRVNRLTWLVAGNLVAVIGIALDLIFRK